MGQPGELKSIRSIGISRPAESHCSCLGLVTGLVRLQALTVILWDVQQGERAADYKVVMPADAGHVRGSQRHWPCRSRIWLQPKVNFWIQLIHRNPNLKQWPQLAAFCALNSCQDMALCLLMHSMHAPSCRPKINIYEPLADLLWIA